MDARWFYNATATTWIDRLLGLEQVSWSHHDVLLAWQYQLPAWVWVLITAACVGVGTWSYNRLIVGRVFRMSLAMSRAMLLVFLAVVLAGPMMVLKREHIEPDVLVVLVDRSGSMQVKDAHAIERENEPPVKRSDAMRIAIEKHRALFGENVLGQDRQVTWLGFDDEAYPIQPNDEGLTPASDGGRTTAIRTAIDQAIEHVSGRPISGIVLFSDGRSAQNTGPDLIRRLNQQAVAVFPVPLGADVPTVDLSLARVDVPDTAFVNDSVPVTVWIDYYPVQTTVDTHHIRVKLIDIQTGQILDERSHRKKQFRSTASSDR